MVTPERTLQTCDEVFILLTRSGKCSKFIVDRSVYPDMCFYSAELYRAVEQLW